MRKRVTVWVGILLVALPGVDLDSRAQMPQDVPGNPGAQQQQLRPHASSLGAAVPQDRFVTVEGRRFIDPQGRQVVLHGLSVINKSKAADYQSWHGPEEFAAMREWGMNCIRLGIFWDGVEPEPGRYDDEYIEKVDKRIAWARDNGLYVLLDMHQDLFSVLYSNGAPEWATLTDGKSHIRKGSVWSDAYFTSPAVQTAFDNFWANKACGDGVGVQEHFALAWQHVAARYAHEPAILGYDLFNEPGPGSQGVAAQLLMVAKFAEAVAEKDAGSTPTVPELMKQWLDAGGRSKLMARLADMDFYMPIIDAAQPLFAEFERTKVMPMFQRVTDAIREVDRNHIIFLETSMSANMGVYSGIEPVLGPDGKREPLQAYAPHGYDIVVDTPDLASASSDRVGLIFARHGETAERLGMPMLVGEWGAYGAAGPEILPSARFVVRQFENLLCSDTYWLFGHNIPDSAYFEVLDRPFPVRIAGTLLSYRSDPESGAFTCVWKEDPKVTAPNRIYLPKRVYPGKEGITLSPTGKGFRVEPARQGGESVYLVVAPTGETVERHVSIAQFPKHLE